MMLDGESKGGTDRSDGECAAAMLYYTRHVQTQLKQRQATGSQDVGQGPILPIMPTIMLTNAKLLPRLKNAL